MPSVEAASGPVEICRDPASDPASQEVYALRGTGFASVQFHPEPVLTEHGIDLLHDLIAPMLRAEWLTAQACPTILA